MKAYQPKTGQRCGCRPGVQRDNCPACEGTGWRVDFAAIRARNAGHVIEANGRGWVTFSGLASSFGAAEKVSYSKRWAWVWLPGRASSVRISRSKLPADPGSWNAFTLADLCATN